MEATETSMEATETSVEATEAGGTLESEEVEKHLRKRLWEAVKKASVQVAENIDRREREAYAIVLRAGQGASVEATGASGIEWKRRKIVWKRRKIVWKRRKRAEASGIDWN